MRVMAHLRARPVAGCSRTLATAAARPARCARRWPHRCDRPAALSWRPSRRSAGRCQRRLRAAGEVPAARAGSVDKEAEARGDRPRPPRRRPARQCSASTTGCDARVDHRSHPTSVVGGALHHRYPRRRCRDVRRSAVGALDDDDGVAAPEGAQREAAHNGSSVRSGRRPFIRRSARQVPSVVAESRSPCTSAAPGIVTGVSTPDDTTSSTRPAGSAAPTRWPARHHHRIARDAQRAAASPGWPRC